MGSFLQGNELLIILVILLLILGPTKLPALARGLGQALREFRKAAQGEYEKPAPPTLEPRPASPGSSYDRATLERIASSLGIETAGKSDEELYREITEATKRKGPG
ncbi:MAG: twin-arginine translocase TatA/TatE family subunit [Desulfurococcales archaeon]|nr:twin-arginine translocase TatA/TatE family subunit [Desulfurococcales archaeon]